MQADQKNNAAGGLPQLLATDPGCLEPPRYGFQPVERRLNARLYDWASLPKVVSVVAAPGYGKTVLLSQLYSAYSMQGVDRVWVGLDERHNDCGRFLTLLEQGLGISAERVPQDALPTRVRRISDLLSRRSTPLVVLFDQLDAAATEEFTPVLDALVCGSSPCVRFVMASVRRLPLSRSSIKGEFGLAEVREADLAFQPCEVAELLSTAGVSGAGADLVSLVFKKTEGWPAAVRLIQIMFANEGPSQALLERFSGSDRDLANLLWRRVMSELEPDFAQLLVELAHLNEFSVSLAVYALENGRLIDAFGELTRLNVPLVALDSSNEWFRFHNLIRDFLISEAVLLVPPGRRNRILVRAAEWLDEHGDAVAALEYALDAGQFHMAARLLDKVAEVTVGDRGELKGFLRWYRLVEASGVPTGFSAQFWYAYSLQLSHRYGAAFQAISALLKECANSREAESLLPRAEFLRITFAAYSDDRDQVLRDGQKWLAKYGSTASPLHAGLVEGCISTVYLAREALADARKYQSSSQALLAPVQSEYIATMGASITAVIMFEEGDVIEAERLLASAAKRVRSSLGQDATVLSIVGLIQSSVLTEQGRDEEARALLEVGLTHAGSDAVIFALRYGFESGVRLPLDESSNGPSVHMLEQIAYRYPPRAAVLLGALRVRRLALLGRVDEAIGLAKRVAITSFGGTGARASADASGVERSLLLLAELEIGVAHGDVVTAREVIEAELKRVNAAGLRRLAVDLYLLLFKLHVTGGNRALAIRSVSRALSVAGRRQILRPFLERGPLLRELFAKTRLKDFNLTLREDIEFLRRLRETLGVEEGSVNGLREDDKTIDIEPLTPREMDLLRCLEVGMTNQQMADRLLLTLPTVKWHLYNLYSKLSVKSRAAALARARGAGILGV